MMEQKTEFFFSFIEGANGAYIKDVVDEESESKLTEVLFKPSASNILELLKSFFSIKPKKYRHKMPEQYIRHIRMPVEDPKLQGTFNNYVFVIPSKDMPNVLYEKTLLEWMEDYEYCFEKTAFTLDELMRMLIGKVYSCEPIVAGLSR